MRLYGYEKPLPPKRNREDSRKKNARWGVKKEAEKRTRLTTLKNQCISTLMPFPAPSIYAQSVAKILETRI